MASYEERLEVARRLRQLDPDDPAWNGAHGFDFPYFADAFFDAVCPNGEEMSSWTERLADLIEPSEPEDMTIGESAQIVCDFIAKNTPRVDRDALLALADEMEIDGAGALDDEDWCKPLLVEYASRIREALGEGES